MPVFDYSGTFAGAAYAALDLEQMDQRLKAVDLPDNVRVFITDPAGVLVASSSAGVEQIGTVTENARLRNMVEAGRQATLDDLNDRGVDMLHVVVPVGQESDLTTRHLVVRVSAEREALTSLKTSEQRNLTAMLGYWAQGVQQITYVTAVVVGTYLVFAGQFTVGTIIAIGILTSRTLGPLAALSATMARWSNTKAALIALDAVAHARQAEESGRTYLRREKLTGAFEISRLDFRYDAKGTPTLDIPALAIPAGQRVAVLGANGSGKSTLLRLFAGLYEPNAGRVMIDGVDIAQVHPRDIRRGIGYLGQDVRLFAGTVRDNLNMTQLERDDDRLLGALDFAGLGQYVRAHPLGLDLEIKEMGEGLSVGQRQSIGWARLWLQNPAVAILDEPTAALDQTLEATMVSRLHTWLDGRTAIIATHRVPILQLTTRTLILQNGRLAVDGPRDAVLAHLNKAQGAGK